ncbi:MAG TPA: hypothetical protein PL105_24395, partial [Caldilineaceae bacterium]|nr:hypothetical protein [Caldilineaceae bacterium]
TSDAGQEQASNSPHFHRADKIDSTSFISIPLQYQCKTRKTATSMAVNEPTLNHSLMVEWVTLFVYVFLPFQRDGCVMAV